MPACTRTHAHTHTTLLLPARPPARSEGYIALVFIIVVLTIVRTYVLAIAGGIAARRIYERLLIGIVYSPMVFFETTPLGACARAHDHNNNNNINNDRRQTTTTTTTAPF
jgi:hypothetical protein